MLLVFRSDSTPLGGAAVRKLRSRAPLFYKISLRAMRGGGSLPSVGFAGLGHLGHLPAIARNVPRQIAWGLA